MKTCYYELLGIQDRSATAEDLKKAFKRRALECHPDKNLDDPEGATKTFTEVHKAYELLSNPHERAWYDAHRLEILRESSGAESEILHAPDLMPFFSSSCYSGFDETAEDNFYTVFKLIFERVVASERADTEDNCVHPRVYPGFGDSKSSRKDVDLFYNFWMVFRTLRSFSQCDKWQTYDSPDRRTRREAERRNKRLRDTGCKEYSDTVKNLACFIKRRDPRVLKFAEREKKLRLQQQNQQLQKIKEKQKIAQQSANIEDVSKTYIEPDWVKCEEQVFFQVLRHGDEMNSENSDFENLSDFEGAYYCVGCDVSFGTDLELGLHEQTKAHEKMVKFLRLQLEEEDRAASLVAEMENPAGVARNEFSCDVCPESVFASEPQLEAHKRSKKHLKNIKASKKPAHEKRESDDTENRAALKENQKKKAAVHIPAPLCKNSCNICGEVFTTRNRLFDHIKESGHASEKQK